MTISAPVAAPGPRYDQIREVNLGLHPGIKESLATLCADPNTIVLILSGSPKDALDEVFALYIIAVFLSLLFEFLSLYFPSVKNSISAFALSLADIWGLQFMACCRERHVLATYKRGVEQYHQASVRHGLGRQC